MFIYQTTPYRYQHLSSACHDQHAGPPTDATPLDSPRLCQPEHFKVQLLPYRCDEDLLRVSSRPILFERVSGNALDIAQAWYVRIIYMGEEPDVGVDCKNRLKSTSWSPAWLRERRNPKFVHDVSDEHTLHPGQSLFGMDMIL